MKKVIIRVDGNANIGLGHIYRGIALAEMLKKDFKIDFVTHVDSTTSPIKDAGFNIVFLPKDIGLLNEPEWLEKNHTKYTIVILDGYQFNEKYQRKIKEKEFKLVYIDDLVEQHMVADLVINHAPGLKETDFSAEPYTKFALGTKYAILRPAFLEAAKQTRRIEKIDTAFVCFGGSDVYDLTLKASKALLQIEQIKKINIVVGASYQNEQIYRLQKKNIIINIYRNLSENELLNIMLESHLGMVPASTILYELCSVKMSILSGFYVENQKNIYNGGRELGVFYPVGNLINIEITQLEHLILELINKKDNLVQTINQALFIDSFIMKRFINIFRTL